MSLKVTPHSRVLRWIRENFNSLHRMYLDFEESANTNGMNFPYSNFHHFAMLIARLSIDSPFTKIGAAGKRKCVGNCLDQLDNDAVDEEFGIVSDGEISEDDNEFSSSHCFRD